MQKFLNTSLLTLVALTGAVPFSGCSSPIHGMGFGESHKVVSENDTMIVIRYREPGFTLSEAQAIADQHAAAKGKKAVFVVTGVVDISTSQLNRVVQSTFSFQDK